MLQWFYSISANV